MGLIILLQYHHGGFHLLPKNFLWCFFFFACSSVWKFHSATKQALGLHINVNLTFMKMFPGTETKLGEVVQV